MNAEIVIIGSGISGLTAAAILAKSGRQVVVIEKNPLIGGALKRFKRQGVAFDVGFHYTGCLGENEILQRIWHYCGVLPKLRILPFPRQGADRLYLKNHSQPVDAFFNYKLFQEELLRHFPEECQGIETYFSTIRRICENVPFYNRKLPVTQFLRGYQSPKISLKTFLGSITTNTALQSVFAAPALCYGIPADNVSIDVHAMVAHGYYQGAYSVSGGGQSIADAYRSTCEGYGVTFLTSETVRTIVTNGSRVSGIVTDSGNMVHCREVIFTGHPTRLIAMTPPGVFRPVYTKRLLDLKSTVSMNILFGTVPQPCPSLDWKNHIFLPDGPDLISSDAMKTADRVLMLTSTERGCNCLQQPNKSVILLQPANWVEVQQFSGSTPRTRPPEYTTYKNTISDSIVRQAIKHWGALIKTITPLTMGTPLTLRDELYTPQGCAYGVMHSLDQYTPDIRTRLPGLLLSGQSTIMTGVVGAAISGMVSAGELLGLESLWEDLR